MKIATRKWNHTDGCGCTARNNSSGLHHDGTGVWRSQEKFQNHGLFFQSSSFQGELRGRCALLRGWSEEQLLPLLSKAGDVKLPLRTLACLAMCLAPFS